MEIPKRVDKIVFRGVINGKAGKAAALSKFSDTLTLSQSGLGVQIMSNQPKIFHVYTPAILCFFLLLSKFYCFHCDSYMQICVRFRDT